MSTQTVRWGILSTADIVRGSFLPALRHIGGVAEAVGGRDPERSRQFARANGINRALDGYQAVIDDPNVDAIYNPLPNSMHPEWTVAALRAGKPVLCEKPLAADLAGVREILDVARETGTLLWEAFVFPFREQSHRLRSWLDEGRIGDVREVQASFHFHLSDHANIRFDPALGGGGLLDVGCYCIRFGRMVFEAETTGGVGVATLSPEGVDVDLQGILSFPGDRRLVLSCGMDRPGSTLARLFGTDGEIRVTNPYHPHGRDAMTLLRPDGSAQDEFRADDVPTFAPAMSHIERAIRGEEQPQHLAIDEALGNAIAIDTLQRSVTSGRVERPQ